ncbi:MAG: hypothetical protein PHU25_14735 [Deltaproteobacteria bacterium]|nr:hypothetical protein [Deltaproteobacteria bacterium]
MSDVRVAVVTSDMGLQWGHHEPPPAGAMLKGCTAFGDDGAFQTYAHGRTIGLPEGEIPCSSQAQCPPGWSCDGVDSDWIGACDDTDDDGGIVECPLLDTDSSQLADSGSLPESLLGCGGGGGGGSRRTESADSDLPLEAACLASVGAQGCGIEQPLIAAVRALDRQPGFLRSDALLAIIIISDEDDCSMNGDGLLVSGDLESAQETDPDNAACAKRPASLFAPEVIGDLLLGRKRGWVFLGAITDVPGGRYAQLIDALGGWGQVEKNTDSGWSSLTETIMKISAAPLCGSCFEMSLEWDPETRVSTCDLVVAASSGLEQRIPKLPADLDCAKAEGHVSKEALGWYYCEDFSEASEDACSDGRDNDGDGLTDCDDPGCEDCRVACGKEFPNATGKECVPSCKYNIVLTAPALELTRAHSLFVRCVRGFPSTDPNCQENTAATCTDGKDNDANGTWDCENVLDAKSRERHMADPNCCPMSVAKGNRCVVDEQTFENCPGTSESKLPDACEESAKMLGCNIATE